MATGEFYCIKWSDSITTKHGYLIYSDRKTAESEHSRFMNQLASIKKGYKSGSISTDEAVDALKSAVNYRFHGASNLVYAGKGEKVRMSFKDEMWRGKLQKCYVSMNENGVNVRYIWLDYLKVINIGL